MLSKFKKFVASLLATTTIIAVVPIIPTHIDHTGISIFPLLGITPLKRPEGCCAPSGHPVGGWYPAPTNPSVTLRMTTPLTRGLAGEATNAVMRQPALQGHPQLAERCRQFVGDTAG